MKALVIGGAGSGKSSFAERLACSLGTNRTYLATMRASGSEAQTRIRRHKAQREGLHFKTIECQGTLPQLVEPGEADDVVLLDDLGNLVADALFLPDGTMCDPTATLDRIADEVLTLAVTCENLVVVGNDVGSVGRYADASTNAWIQLMGTLCCRIAARFDVVVEVVCGQPLLVKGELS